MIRAIESAKPGRKPDREIGAGTDPYIGKAKAAGDMRKGGGGNARKGELRSTPSTAAPPPTLAELGVSKNLSSRATLEKEHLQ